MNAGVWVAEETRAMGHVIQTNAMIKSIAQAMAIGVKTRVSFMF